MKKKVFVAIMCLTLVFMAVNSALASEFPTEDNISSSVGNVASISSASHTITLYHNSASANDYVYLGFNPTVTVSASGNSNLRLKIWYITPAGNKGDVGYIYANNSDTITKNIFFGSSGYYCFYVQPYGGTTNGQNVIVTITIN